METARFTTLMSLFDRYENSDQTALICGEETLTYRELLRDAKHIAKGLVLEGIKKGDRVVHCMRRTADAIRGLLGILYAGGAYVVIDPDWPEERRRFITEDTGAVLSLTDEVFQSLWAGEVPEDILLPDVQGEDEIAVYYTSGSTGVPKGAALMHAVSAGTVQHLNNFEQKWDNYQCIVKFSYINAFESCFQVFVLGRTLLLSTEEALVSIDQLGKTMELGHADAISGTPSMILRFLDNAEFRRAFSRIKYVCFYGEKVAMTVINRVQAAAHAEIYIFYGCSEMGNCGCYHYRNDGRIHLGTAPSTVTRYVLDPEMNPVGPGQEGELYIGGIPAEHGYYVNRPELNAEKYVNHPLYGRIFRIGDLVRQEEDGELTVTGRKDGMVKLRGQRIETAGVETRIEQFEGIDRAAVKLIGQSPQEALACWYTVFDEQVSETKLRRFLARHLPYYMVPTLYMKLDAMPENDHGKLNYRALPDISLPEQDYCAPETEAEQILCDVFREVLKTDKEVSVNDSFFDLGGDSISAMEAASRLRKWGYSFELRLIFTSPSARKLAPLLTLLSQKQEETSYEYQLAEAQREWIAQQIGWDQVEGVYPVTREMRVRLMDRDPWMQYALFEIPAAQLEKMQFLSRVKELTQKRTVLRSVFACAQGEEPLQVVLRGPEPECFFVDLSRLSQNEGLSAGQKAYFRSLLRIDAERKRDPAKEVLFRTGVIRISESASILYLSYSHLLLDGASMARFVFELLNPSDITGDRETWNRRMLRLREADPSEGQAYWNSLLQGCRGLTQLPGGRRDEEKPQMGSCFAAGGKKLCEKAVRYCKMKQMTMAALVHYAFGRCLMELSGEDDVCFYSIASGRTEEDMELAGTLAVPIPVRLRREDSVADCQAQLLSSVAYGHWWETSDLHEAVFGDQLPAALDIQNYFTDYGEGCRKMDLFQLAESPEQMQGLLQLIVPEFDKYQVGISVTQDENFSCTGFYNGTLYDPDVMKRIPRELLRQIRNVIE